MRCPAWVIFIMMTTASCRLPTGLDLKLMKQVTNNLGSNEAISPFLIAQMMSQLWLATNGTTRNEITSVLSVTEPAETTFLPAFKTAIESFASSSRGVNVNIFSGMYVRSGFSVKPSFADYLSRFYNTSVVTFTDSVRTANEINGAVSRVTNNTITQVVSPSALGGNTALVLVSAMYFKGLWRNSFASVTRRSFLTMEGEKSVTMMRISRPDLQFTGTDTYRVVSLPYADENYVMLLIQPRQRTINATTSLRTSLDTIDIDGIIQKLTPSIGELFVPRFKIEANYVLNDEIAQLGIRSVFSPVADFSGLTKHQASLAVGSIFHKVVIEVNEQGTSAAGAGILAFPRSEPLPFIVDRPFFTVVYNKQLKINMFTGFVGNPTSA